MKRIIWIFVAIIILFPKLAFSQEITPVEFEIKTDKKNYKVGEPMTIFYIIRNVSNNRINYFCDPYSETTQSLYFMDENGERIYQDKGRGSSVMYNECRMISLDPNETYEVNFPAKVMNDDAQGIYIQFDSDPYKFKLIDHGRYSMQAEYTEDFRFCCGSSDWQDSKCIQQNLWKGRIISNIENIEIIN